jgi:hypothetical protein
MYSAGENGCIPRLLLENEETSVKPSPRKNQMIFVLYWNTLI